MQSTWNEPSKVQYDRIWPDKSMGWIKRGCCNIGFPNFHHPISTNSILSTLSKSNRLRVNAMIHTFFSRERERKKIRSGNAGKWHFDKRRSYCNSNFLPAGTVAKTPFQMAPNQESPSPFFRFSNNFSHPDFIFKCELFDFAKPNDGFFLPPFGLLVLVKLI